MAKKQKPVLPSGHPVPEIGLLGSPVPQEEASSPPDRTAGTFAIGSQSRGRDTSRSSHRLHSLDEAGGVARHPERPSKPPAARTGGPTFAANSTDLAGDPIGHATELSKSILPESSEEPSISRPEIQPTQELVALLARTMRVRTEDHGNQGCPVPTAPC